jgi:hypothetical protein
MYAVYMYIDFYSKFDYKLLGAPVVHLFSVHCAGGTYSTLQSTHTYAGGRGGKGSSEEVERRQGGWMSNENNGGTHQRRVDNEGNIRRENPRYLGEWEMVLKLVEYCFIYDTEEAPRAFEVGILALMIPKDVTSYRDIVLLESIYKLVSLIITRRLTDANEFHDALQGFRGGRGTATATIKLKLLTQHTRNCGVENLYIIFLDWKKVYYSLDRDRRMATLKGYGVGRNLQAFIKRKWDGDAPVSKQAGFFGVPYDVG